MVLRVLPNDIVFDAHGRAGVVLGHKEATGELVVQTSGPEFEAARRKGVINGLTQQERRAMDKVLDEVGGIPDPEEKVRALSEKIDQLKMDPRQHVVTRYLSGELAHIMMTERVRPREYSSDELEVR